MESSVANRKRAHATIVLTGSGDPDSQSGPTNAEYAGSQQQAYDEIMASLLNGTPAHCLTGYAGTGKTTMLSKFVLAVLDLGKEIFVTATTNKAVAVIAGKMPESVTCQTIHRLLGRKVETVGGRKRLVPKVDRVLPPDGSVVVIDECSMIGAELMTCIRSDLRRCFVLFVGDPAQLPPVNEQASPSFSMPRSSHLTKVIRQGAGNPIVRAATRLRGLKEGEVDLSWLRTQRSGNDGIFVLDHDVQKQWMDRAFTSAEFRDDPDAFRYLAWRNATVEKINRRIREKIYGRTDTPFIPGEKAVAGEMISQRGTEVVIANSETVTVVDISEGGRRFTFDKVAGSGAWTAGIPGYQVTLEGEMGELTTWLPTNTAIVRAALGRLEAEALKLAQATRIPDEENERWLAHAEVEETFSDLKHVYAMTVHKSQGSTFKRAFIDFGDIISAAPRAGHEVASQLLYVALTRASSAAFLCNVPLSLRDALAEEDVAA